MNGTKSEIDVRVDVGRNRIHRREWRRPGRAIAQASATIRACRPEFAGLSNMPAYFIERLRLHQQAIAASTFKPDLPNTLLNFPTNYPKYSDDKHTRQRNR